MSDLASSVERGCRNVIREMELPVRSEDWSSVTLTCCSLEDVVRAAIADEHMEHSLLQESLSRPEIDDFWEGIVTEAAHQRQRWGDAHDRDKSAENWFWLVGYLSGKALRAAIEGDKAKAKHHTISTAAALFQWHKAICSDESGCGIGHDEDIDPEVGRLGAEPA